MGRLPLEQMARKTKQFGYDGIELACWGDHFEVDKADDAYCRRKRDLLNTHELQCHAISAHLVGQAICDKIDERHKAILPPYVWGDGKPDGVNQRAAEELKNTARAAKRLGVSVVNGFTGSSIWPLLYSFPPGAGEDDRRWVQSCLRIDSIRFSTCLPSAVSNSRWRFIRPRSRLISTRLSGR